jgi:hypothetical protein
MSKKAELPRKRIQRKIQNSLQLNARDIFEALALIGDGKTTLDSAALKRFSPYVERVFDQLKLDGKKEENWAYATALLAYAVYFRRPPGRKLSWTKKKVRRLKKDINALRASYPNESELELCTRLLAAQPRKYKGEPETLRRRLYVKTQARAKRRKASKPRDPWLGRR